LGITGECEQTKRGRKTNKKIKIRVEDMISQKKVKEIFKIMKKESPKDKNKTRMNSEQTKMKKDFRRNTSTSRTKVNLISSDSILYTEIEFLIILCFYG